MTSLNTLIDRIRGLTGPDREVDAEVERAIWGNLAPRRPDAYTASLDAVVALIERELPGWAWKVGTCCVSDDAWVCPDFNSPEHGERLKRELPYETMKAGSIWDGGIDIDRRPSGSPVLALLEAALTAIKERAA